MRHDLFRRALRATPLSMALVPLLAFSQSPIELPGDAPKLAQMAIDMTLGDGGQPMGGAERVVKGAPYCADAVHENVQWLPDGQGGMGNRISHKTTTRLCRDGEGRTRQEAESGGRKLVYLADPVARENWVLDPERKTARQIGGSGGFSWSGSWSGGIDSSAWRDYAERMREWARGMAEGLRGHEGRQPQPPQFPQAPQPPAMPAAPPVPPAAAMPPGVTASSAPRLPALAALSGMPTPAMVELTPGQRTNEVRVYRFDGSAAVPPGEVRWRAQQWAPRGQGAASSLGSKDIEGLRAHGERTTWTIEAGKVGNEKPIVITREVWTSPELMLQVQSRDFDPRSGEVSYRLVNVKRGEPDGALMKVPGDFKSTRRSERIERNRSERS